jgi:signal transduction histidine kinase
MNGDVSLRTRLTLTLLVLTGLVSALSVLVGMSILRSNVREAAVEDQLEGFLDLGFIQEEFGATEAITADSVFQDGFEVILDDDFALDIEEFNQFEAEYVGSIINKLGLYPQLTTFATDDGTVNLLLSTGSVVAVDGSGVINLDPVVDEDDVVVLSSSFDEIAGGIFEPVGFNDPEEERIFEFASTEVDGTRLGTIVEVTDELRALDEVSRALWLSAAVVTALAAGAAWVLIGRALGPVDAITQRVGEISSGNLSERVPEPRRRDEIGVLASTMNTMLGRLENSDLKRRQFISDASHELRTPVAVLQSEAEVARRAPDTTSVAELSDVVLTESRRMGSMVEDLLAIARSDEGRLRPDGPREVDVDEIVLDESMRSRRVPVDRGAVSAGRVVGQPDEVGRAMAHLLDNAARHANEQVAVGVRTEGDEVVCWVDDDGPGIPPRERRRIFDRFVRLDDARTRDRGGAGLGLAVVASTVEKMGGSVVVEDAPLGGARFEIRWPAA